MRLLPASLSPSEHRRADEFAQLLDGSRATASPQLQQLVAVAASLRPVPLSLAGSTPRLEFRDELRATLVEAANARTPAPAPARRGGSAGVEWGPPRTHRLRTAVASTLLVAMLGAAGAAWASSRALPGDPLYGLKRGLENVQLDLARGDTAQGREHLEQAAHRLGEAEALAASEDARSGPTRGQIAAALRDTDTAAVSGADELTAAYADSGDAAPLDLLERFVTEQRARLADLEAVLDPTLRAQARSLADTLGALQARVEVLVPAAAGGAASALGPLDATVSAARASGDGWAVSRVVDQVRGLGQVPRVAPAAGGGPTQAAGGGPTQAAGGTAAAAGGDAGGVGGAGGGAGGDVGKAVGGVTGAGGGSSGSAQPGIPLPTVTLPPVGHSTPLPTVTLPTVPVPQVTVPSLPPVSLPVPSVTLPAGPPTGLPCVPVPPVTHC